VVQVRNGRRSAASGFLVHRDGLILTNAHVVRRSYPQVWLFDGRRMNAQVLAHDEALDLAVLAVEVSGLPALPIAEKQARPGDWVLAVGHPWGLRDTATAGIVVETGDALPHLGGRAWIMADLHLAPGNSGGPLVDAQGDVLGVNTMLTAHGLGVAVPASEAQAFLRDVVPRTYFLNPEL
jgi:serine protease Do